MKKIILILLFFINSIYSQDKLKEMSISGNLKVSFGLNVTTPKNALIVLTPNHQIVHIDSLGNYKFENLKSGIYKIQVIEFNKKPEEFKIELKNESITNFNIYIIADCEVNSQIAELDIEKNKPRLLLIGGIAPLIYYGQEKFEKKYSIEYDDFGCIAPSNECIIQYNKFIFKYLDKKYGKKWRKEVRKDVIGL